MNRFEKTVRILTSDSYQSGYLDGLDGRLARFDGRGLARYHAGYEDGAGARQIEAAVRYRELSRTDPEAWVRKNYRVMMRFAAHVWRKGKGKGDADCGEMGGRS
jgi:hypothetical protein